MPEKLLADHLQTNARLQTNIDKYQKYISEYIDPNLKHTLRPYQRQALINLMYLQEQKPDIVNMSYNQLMFNMATGSGKTDLMAAIMLYMYRRFHYQEFIYTIGSNDVIEKTKDNFTDSWSDKYLFNNPVTMDGVTIDIEAVSRFPSNPDSDKIYVCMKTIEELDVDLNNPKENQPTIPELRQQKLVILADEAHHYNASTKKRQKENISGSWEDTLNTIRGLRDDNRQFEFTATINLDKKAIRNKYIDKIVYKYDLDQFMAQKYSKQVYWTRARNSDTDKMMLAVMMSQYRKRLAKDLKINNFKPIILFKSTKIKESNANRDKFINLMNSLTGEKLQQFINKELRIIDPKSDKALQIVFSYWTKQDLNKVVHELQFDFNNNKRRIIDANSIKDIMADDYRSLNTLESPDNPFRVIFEVNKLNEGWDVLNLFDIVRLGTGAITTKKTDSEAQLIGRGARYYPFNYPKRQGSKYQRCFDEYPLKYRLLESLFYYTFNDPKYIKHLRKSFDKIKLPVHDNNKSYELSTTVKKKFIDNSNGIYKHGKLYANIAKRQTKDQIHSLNDLGIDTNAINYIDISNSLVETTLNDAKNDKLDHTNQPSIRVVNEYLGDDPRLVKKAMMRTTDKNHFYRFSGLSKYLPIKSLHEFRCSKRWLGGIRLNAYVDPKVNHLTIKERLHAVELFLGQIRATITKNFNKAKGTNIFYPIPISEVVHDYSKQVPKLINQSKATSRVESHTMRGHDWFVYNDAIVDGLEWRCINMIKGLIPAMRTKYKNIYLIRNDEKSDHRIALHDFRRNAVHFQTYLPDFVLYLDSKSNDNIIDEFYIEPKGPQLFTDNENESLNHNDIWKENLLNFIRPKNIRFGPSESADVQSSTLISGNKSNIKLYGLKFFVPNDARNTEKQLRNILSIKPNNDLLQAYKLKNKIKH